MNPTFALNALLIWSAQILVLAAAGALASLALSHSKAKLYFWQGLVLAMVLLPAIEPWKHAAAAAHLIAPGAISITLASAPSAAKGIHWSREYWIWLLAAGAMLRLLWIGAGLLRLRGYRKQAAVLIDPPLRLAAPTLGWYLSEAIPGPVTYGWLRPSILLPARILELPQGAQEAVAWHELVHVRRRDWLFVLAEELVRSLLWFHPAVWYALSRIQLAREQVADREAVRMSRNREGYLEALVAVAAQKLRPDLAPAPLFLRKRHLSARVAALLKDLPVSRPRIAASSAAVLSAVLLAARAAIWFFPFVAPAQTMPDDPGIVVDAGATLLHRAPVHYPRAAETDGGNVIIIGAGTVVVEANLRANGEVADARVLSGPEELRNAALTSVLQWHYLPGPTSVQATIQFKSPTWKPPARRAANIPDSQSQAGIIDSLSFAGISQQAEQDLRSRIQIRQGDSVSQTDLERAAGIVKAFDEHLYFSAVWSGPAGDRKVRIRIGAPLQANGSMPLPGPPPPPGVTEILPEGGSPRAVSTEPPHIVKKVSPLYPALAKQARIQGVVKLSAVIGTDGTVQDLKVISGHPLLAQAALDAVKQWAFQPTLLNGRPVRIKTALTINFTLSQ